MEFKTHEKFAISYSNAFQKCHVWYITISKFSKLRIFVTDDHSRVTIEDDPDFYINACFVDVRFL